MGLLLAFIEAIPKVKIYLCTLINYQAQHAQDQLTLTSPLSTPLEWDDMLSDLRRKIKSQSQTALAPLKQVQLTTDSNGHAWGADVTSYNSTDQTEKKGTHYSRILEQFRESKTYQLERNISIKESHSNI
jgi:hypothetical protein